MNTISCKAVNLAMNGAKTNYYKVLSLESETVTVEEIKKAYRSMALRYHPDACPPSRKEESAKMFVELHRAYETLSNPVLREEYDSKMRSSGNHKAGRSEFSREVWEAQLSGLKVRSDQRERSKNSFR